MGSHVVKYWYAPNDHILEPLASTWEECKWWMDRQGLTWCPTCKVAVDAEGGMDWHGMTSTCPFCGEDLDR